MAQLVAHLICNQAVVGSIPTDSTTKENHGPVCRKHREKG